MPLEALERAGVLRADAVDQDLVELADLARAGHRERQHVPEREAEIVDQHFAARVGMPLRRIERGQQIVEVAGAGVELDLGRERARSAGRACRSAARTNDAGIGVQVLCTSSADGSAGMMSCTSASTSAL